MSGIQERPLLRPSPQPHPARSALAPIAALLLALVVSASCTGPTIGGRPAASPTRTPVGLPVAQRIAVTGRFYRSIERLVQSDSPLATRFDDPTGRIDVLDYGVDSLWRQGLDGSGVTVAFIVPVLDPGLASTLQAYDRLLGLPAAKLSQMQAPAPTGRVLACPAPQACAPGEDRLDAEAIHTMAPYAKLLFVEPPVPETLGMQGWPQVAQAIESVANRHLADVISVSLGDGEADFAPDPLDPGAQQAAEIHSLDPAFLDAAAQSVPVLFGSGDCGPTEAAPLFDTGQCTPTVGLTASHPTDSPWVTAVGGTIPDQGIGTPSGRLAPDALWTAPDSSSDAEGAGVSALYPKPSWQQKIPALAGVTGRAYPDLSLDATNGTSQATPTLAGILALATQLRGRDLGSLNETIAAIGPGGAKAGIVDVPAGYANSAFGVTGYATGTGYDIASGWGTISAPAFVHALVGVLNSRADRATRPTHEAKAQLRALEGDTSVTPSAVRSGQDVTVTGHGFIPGATPDGTRLRDGFGVYPPIPGEAGSGPGIPLAPAVSTVPGETWDTVSAKLATGNGARVRGHVQLSPANGVGDVVVHVATHGLRPGRYRLTLTGDLLTQNVSFRVR